MPDSDVLELSQRPLSGQKESVDIIWSECWPFVVYQLLSLTLVVLAREHNVHVRFGSGGFLKAKERTTLMRGKEMRRRSDWINSRISYAYASCVCRDEKGGYTEKPVPGGWAKADVRAFYDSTPALLTATKKIHV